MRASRSRARHRQPMGIVHGGTYAALAESLCSIATYSAVSPESIAMGQSNSTSFLRPVAEGTVQRQSRAAGTGAAPPGCGTWTSPTTRTACAPPRG